MYDSRVKSLTPWHACMPVEEWLYDPPRHEQKVGQGPRDLRMADRIVGAQSAEQSVNHLLTLKTLYWGLTPCTKYEHVHSLLMGSGPLLFDVFLNLFLLFVVRSVFLHEHSVLFLRIREEQLMDPGGIDQP